MSYHEGFRGLTVSEGDAVYCRQCDTRVAGPATHDCDGLRYERRLESHERYAAASLEPVRRSGWNDLWVRVFEREAGR